MSSNKDVFVLAEVEDGRPAAITAELLGRGRSLANELGQELCAIIIGHGVAGAAAECVSLGADRVYVIDAPLFDDYLADSYVAALSRLCAEVRPEILLFGHTSTGRDLAPALAFRLKTGVTLDCTNLNLDPDTGLLKKTKPVYGSNAVATYLCEIGRPQMAAIRPRVMPPAEYDSTRKGEIIPFKPEIDESLIRGRIINKIREERKGIKLEDASVIVCGGRGLGGAEPFRKLEELAGVLNGAVGATRPPCDAGWVPDNYQIGLTGRLVAPGLYIGIALSGSSQHLSGISGAKTIVAINKDPKASIFKVARYGIVAEFQELLPALIDKCREVTGQK